MFTALFEQSLRQGRGIKLFFISDAYGEHLDLFLRRNMSTAEICSYEEVLDKRSPHLSIYNRAPYLIKNRTQEEEERNSNKKQPAPRPSSLFPPPFPFPTPLAPSLHYLICCNYRWRAREQPVVVPRTTPAAAGYCSPTTQEMNTGGFSTERGRRPRDLPVVAPRTTTTAGYYCSPPTEEKSAGGFPTQRRRKPRVYGLRTFLDPRCPTDFAGAFRDNILAYLAECADVEEGYRLGGMPVWCTLLVDEKTGAVAPLYAVEECVRGSSRPLCDHCRCAGQPPCSDPGPSPNFDFFLLPGWSHHLVSKRRYHLIIPSDEDWDREALRSEALELQSHILHGFIHCSGFGHLLCINGRDGGSHFVSGADVMDLWDRLCTALRAREITVEDSSRKGSMELRLLLSVAQGTTWFGRWGYTFRLGSFGVTQTDYQNSVDLLSSLDMNRLIEEMGQIGREGEQLRRLVHTYRSLADSDSSEPHHLTTLRDLLRFLLGLKHRRGSLLHPPRAAEKRLRAPASTTPPQDRRRCREFDTVAAELDSRWPVRRLRMAAHVVADALELQPGGMTRQEVRDSVRLTIGDTGLIDFVLKCIGDCMVGNRVVRRTQNADTRVLQFSLDDVPGGAALDDPVATPSVESPRAVSTRIAHPSPGQVERDTLWVYKHVLLQARPRAAEVVLHSKRWAKAWGLRDDGDDSLRFLCGWIPQEKEPTRPPQPPEVLVLPPHATVRDLIEEAGRAFRDTYCAMEEFRVAAVEGVAGEGAEPLFGCGAESGAHVWVRGEGADLAGGSGGPVYEGGRESWTVRCSCGTRDDDGERMVACDVCEVWQHTRCAGIADGDAVPPMFLCMACRHTILLLRHTAATRAEEEYDYDGFRTC
ncbi:hypothetical protein Taro_018909 [Colocasia esculenta]|uniref:Zinc finger PHD-type domain-containing protein n=1 Tax=Colocasia esculenta TaxID=4460 RepID=A0A843UV06_COLES|nr:hypothetical protein [Colocasia esculenta]